MTVNRQIFTELRSEFEDEKRFIATYSAKKKKSRSKTNEFFSQRRESRRVQAITCEIPDRVVSVRKRYGEVRELIKKDV